MDRILTSRTNRRAGIAIALSMLGLAAAPELEAKKKKKKKRCLPVDESCTEDSQCCEPTLCNWGSCCSARGGRCNRTSDCCGATMGCFYGYCDSWSNH